MSFSKVGQTTAIITNGSGGQAVALPGGLAENDIVIVAVAADVTCANCISTAGYTSLNNSASADPGQHLAWKRMGATPDATVTITRNALVRRAAAVQVWRGVDQSTAIDNGLSNSTGGSGLPNPGSHATSTHGALRVAVGYLDDDDATISAAPAGYSNLVFANTGLGSVTVGATVMIASKTAGDAGAEDPGAFSSGADDAWSCDHFALRHTIVSGPFVVEAGQLFTPGAVQADLYVPGPRTGAAQLFVPGSSSSQLFVPGAAAAHLFVPGAAAAQLVPP